VVLVDERVGSRELLSSLRALGVDAELSGKLDADFQFIGEGEDGPVLVGLERKDIQDLLNSMRDGRLAGQQLPQFVRAYEVRYLVVEGIWRRQRSTGLVEIKNGVWVASRGKHKYAEVVGFLCRLQALWQVQLWRTADAEETSALLAEVYSWWQKPWEEHKRHAIYAPVPVPKGRPSWLPHESSLLEEWLSRLPGIADRAIPLAKYFSSPRDMADADVDRWLTIRGERIGKKTAEKIVEAITNDDHANSS